MSALPKHVALTSIELNTFFNDSHRALAERLEGVVSALLAADSHDPKTVAAAVGRTHGLFRYFAPAAPGSDQLDVRALVLIREALAYASPLADALFAVQGLGTYAIAIGCNEEQHALLDALLCGDRIAAFALTEPEAGSDIAALQTEARRDGDHWVLDGEKTLIGNVPIADVHVVFAKSDPNKGRKGISAFIVPKEAAGLTCIAQPMSVDHPIGRLQMRGCRVAATAQLGELGAGFGIAMQALGTFRISVGAAACGIAAAALEDSIVHVQRRQQFGKPLALQQLVQAYLAEMATELDASRLLVARASHVKDTQGGQPTREVAMAKMFATEAAQRIVDKAVQLHGGRGVLSGTRVEALYRDIRPLRIYEGTTEIQKLLIARTLFQAPPKRAKAL